MIHRLRPIHRLLVVLALLVAALPARAFDTAASAAWVYDVTTHTVLMDKNADQPLPPASMSKLMTINMLFEALRDKSDTTLKASGARPKIFLANLGTAADFTARATFAKSFFETGGIEALDTQGFADPGALATAFKASGADIACLCSSRTET